MIIVFLNFLVFIKVVIIMFIINISLDLCLFRGIVLSFYLCRCGSRKMKRKGYLLDFWVFVV